MKKGILLASLLFAAVLLVGVNAHATIINFDSGITLVNGYGDVGGTTYMGYNWTLDNGAHLGVVSNSAYNSDYGNNITFPTSNSGNNNNGNAAYNQGANTVALTAANGSPFIFNGAQFWSWTMAPSGATNTNPGSATGGVSTSFLSIIGWLNGVAVYNFENGAVATPIDFWNRPYGWGGIPKPVSSDISSGNYSLGGIPWTVDKVTFSLDPQTNPANGGTYWLMDSVNVAATPVPPSLYLLAAGLVGTLVARRRSSKVSI